LNAALLQKLITRQTVALFVSQSCMYVCNFKSTAKQNTLINSTGAIVNTAFRHSTALFRAQNYMADLLLRFRQGPYVWPLGVGTHL